MKKPDITLAELLGVDQALSEVAMPPTPAPGSVGASTSMKVGSVGVPTPSTGASATFAVHADLHSHSTISDGSFTAEELLQQAADAHITHLAITNHDTTYGIDAIQRAAVHYPVRYIGGIEISAYDFKRNRKVHVLGLGVKEQSPAIKELCDPVLKRRSENTQWQQERLERCGYVLNTEVLHRLRKASTGFYKQHLMAALTSAPYTSSAYQQLYRKLFKGNGICHRDITYVDMGDAVRAITEDGGGGSSCASWPVGQLRRSTGIGRCGVVGHRKVSSRSHHRRLASCRLFGTTLWTCLHGRIRFPRCFRRCSQIGGVLDFALGRFRLHKKRRR